MHSLRTVCIVEIERIIIIRMLYESVVSRVIIRLLCCVPIRCYWSTNMNA